ncbi:hypothetical protein QTO34_012975, partial [Cnephaeus nilssonii]
MVLEEATADSATKQNSGATQKRMGFLSSCAWNPTDSIRTGYAPRGPPSICSQSPVRIREPTSPKNAGIMGRVELFLFKGFLYFKFFIKKKKKKKKFSLETTTAVQVGCGGGLDGLMKEVNVLQDQQGMRNPPVISAPGVLLATLHILHSEGGGSGSARSRNSRDRNSRLQDFPANGLLGSSSPEPMEAKENSSWLALWTPAETTGRTTPTPEVWLVPPCWQVCLGSYEQSGARLHRLLPFSQLGSLEHAYEDSLASSEAGSGNFCVLR